MKLHDDLYHQALQMAVDKNLHDVGTLLEWARGEPDPAQKAHHIDRVIALLRDVRAQLAAAGAPQS